MNKLKFIPVLAVAALLSACGGNSVSVKAPKFAKVGNEVEATKFAEDAMKALEEFDFMKSEEALGSKILDTKNSTERTNKLTRNKKVVSEYSYQQVSNQKGEFDAKNHVAKVANVANTAILDKDTNGTYEEKESQKANVYLQEVTYEDEKYMGAVVQEEKIVQVLAKETTEFTIANIYEELSRGSYASALDVSTAMMFLSQIEYIDAEELSHFKFYENGSNTFTVEYSDEDEDDVNADETVVGKKVETFTQKFQYVIKGSSISYAFLEEEISTVTYSADYEQYYAGDVYEEAEKSYKEASYKDGKVSVKAVGYEGYNFLIA